MVEKQIIRPPKGELGKEKQWNEEKKSGGNDFIIIRKTREIVKTERAIRGKESILLKEGRDEIKFKTATKKWEFGDLSLRTQSLSKGKGGGTIGNRENTAI